MSARFVCGIGPCRRAAVLLFCAAAVMASGCGSSGSGDGSNAPATATGKPNPEDFYRHEGTGANKKKVPVSRKERVTIIREAREKAGSQP
jgi:hypothetical protein